MIASAHIAAGTVAGMAGAYATRGRIRGTAAAFGLGILSHVVLDAVPHSDLRMLLPSAILWVSLCETVAMCAIAAYILRQRLVAGWPGFLLAGLAGSSIPDAKFAARILLPENSARRIEYYGDYVHSFFHSDPMSVPMIGLGIEVASTVGLLVMLTSFPRVTTRVSS